MSLSDSNATLGRRLRAWARNRQGEDSTPLVLEARRIYILPTKAGLAAAVLLLLMLLAALNYNNNLALALCFSLVGVILLSMHQCHRNLLRLAITRAQIEPSHAGERGVITLHLGNDDDRQRQALVLRCATGEPQRFDIAPGVSTTHQVPYLADQRGRLHIDRIELSSDAPLGLFRAWAWLYLPLDTLIYPTPAGRNELPAPLPYARGEYLRANARGEEEWASLRPYQVGDSPRRVAWKVYARGAPLLTSVYEARAGSERVLDYGTLKDLPLEARLSQLTLWVLECQRRHEPFALRLPGHNIGVGAGADHRRRCLETLAVFGL